MIIAIVNAGLSEPLSTDAAVERFTKSAPSFQGIPGLRQKHYLRALDGASAGGAYLWESLEAAERFYTEEWHESMTARFGYRPTVQFFESFVSVSADAIASVDRGSVSRVIAAPPEAVFAAVTDITRMGEFSPETSDAEWLDDADEPAVGARFVGHNRLPAYTWSIEAEITELIEGHRFAFDCYSPSSGKVISRWSYDIEPADGGCRITESFEDHRSEESRARMGAVTGVDDRVAHNIAGMRLTLERLAAACEAD